MTQETQQTTAATLTIKTEEMLAALETTLRIGDYEAYNDFTHQLQVLAVMGHPAGKEAAFAVAQKLLKNPSTGITSTDIQRTTLYLYSAAIKPEEGETEPYPHADEIPAIAEYAKSKINMAFSNKDGIVDGAISCAESCALRRPDLAAGIALRVIRHALTSEVYGERSDAINTLKEIMQDQPAIADVVLEEISHRTRYGSTVINNPEALHKILRAVAGIEGDYDFMAMKSAKEMAANSQSAEQVTAAIDAATNILRDTKDQERRTLLIPDALVTFTTAVQLSYNKNKEVPAYPNRIKYLLGLNVFPAHVLPDIAHDLAYYCIKHPSNEAQEVIEQICTKSEDKICKAAHKKVVDLYQYILPIQIFSHEQLLDSLANDSFSTSFRNSLLTNDLFEEISSISVDLRQSNTKRALARHVVAQASRSSKRHAALALKVAMRYSEKRDDATDTQCATMIHTSLSAFPALANRKIVAKLEELAQHNHENVRGWAELTLDALKEKRGGLFRKAAKQVTVAPQPEADIPDLSAPLRGITAQLSAVEAAYRELRALKHK